MSEQSPEFAPLPAESYLARRLAEQLNYGDVADGGLRDYLQKLKQLDPKVDFAYTWDGIIQHGRAMYREQEPFDINAFLCGALLGLRTVEAADKPDVITTMAKVNVNQAKPVRPGVVEVRPDITRPEAKRGWSACLDAMAESEDAVLAVAHVMEHYQIFDDAEVRQFELGMGWVVAGYQSAHAPDLDAELAALIGSQEL